MAHIVIHSFGLYYHKCFVKKFVQINFCKSISIRNNFKLSRVDSDQRTYIKVDVLYVRKFGALEKGPFLFDIKLQHLQPASELTISIAASNG